MDIQFILVIMLFAAAVFYVGRMVYRAVSPKSDGCEMGCGKCSANFENIPTPKK